MEPSSGRHDQSSTPHSALHPSQENGGAGLKISSLLHDLVFLVISPHPGVTQEPTESRLLGTKDAPITQEITRVSRALCQAPVAETNVHLFHHLKE